MSLKQIEGCPVSPDPLEQARDIYDGGGRFISLPSSNSLFPQLNNRWPHSVDISKLEKLSSFMIETIANLAN